MPSKIEWMPLDASHTNMTPAPALTSPPFQAAISPSSLRSISWVAGGSEPRTGATWDQLLRASFAAIRPAAAASGRSDRKSQNAISAPSPSHRFASRRLHRHRSQPSMEPM